MKVFKCFSYYELIIELAKKEIRDKIHGSTLGVIWLVFIPFVQMAIYIVFFTYVLELKVNTKGPGDYGLYILAGIIPWLSFLEVLNKSTSIIKANSSLVKQIIFPVEVLPLKGALSSLMTQGIFHLILAAYLIYRGLFFNIYFLIIPLAFLQMLFFSGISFFISAISVFFKDFKEIVNIFCMIGIYFLPIIFTVEMIPEFFVNILYLNPLSHMIFVYQDVCYFGFIAHYSSWIIWTIFCLFTFITGNIFFNYMKKNFGDFV